MFCETFSYLPEYRQLPKEERTILNWDGIQHFAGRRLLAYVLERERAKCAGAGGNESEELTG
jgi:hypothetical protein